MKTRKFQIYFANDSLQKQLFWLTCLFFRIGFFSKFKAEIDGKFLKTASFLSKVMNDLNFMKNGDLT